MWDYYWGLTERQVDLLLVDQALVVYHNEKTKGQKKKNGVREMDAPSSLDVAEATAKWNAKYGNGQKPKIILDFGQGTQPERIGYPDK